MTELGELEDDRQVERDGADVAAPDRDGPALFIAPEREEGAAAHGRRDGAVLLEDLGDAAVLGRKAQVVRVHALGGGPDGLVKELGGPLVGLDLALVIEIDKLREDDGLAVLAVAVAADLEHDAADRHEPLALLLGEELGIPLTESDRREGEIAAAARHGVELQFEGLEALLELAHDVARGDALDGILVKAEVAVLGAGGGEDLLDIGQEHLVKLGQREAAELLGGRHKRDVTDHLKSGKHGLGLGILDVRHLEAALEDVADVEEAAVDAAEDHVAQVVDVDVAALDQGLLLARKIELLVEALREVALDQGALRGDERAVVVSVLAVAEAQHVVGILTELLERAGVRRFVVAVFGIGLRHLLVLLGGENGDDKLVKLKHGHLVAALKARTDLTDDAGETLVVDERVAAEGRLLHRVNDLLVNEFFGRVVLLDNRQHVVVLLLILLNSGRH